MEYTVNPDGTVDIRPIVKPQVELSEGYELSEDWIEYDEHKLFK
jgi:hypothetical protein